MSRDISRQFGKSLENVSRRLEITVHTHETSRGVSCPGLVSPLDTTPPQAPSKQKQLTDFEKGKIIFAYELWWSYQRIADYIG